MARRKSSATVSVIKREIAAFQAQHKRLGPAKAAQRDRKDIALKIKLLKSCQRLLTDFFFEHSR